MNAGREHELMNSIALNDILNTVDWLEAEGVRRDAVLAALMTATTSQALGTFGERGICCLADMQTEGRAMLEKLAQEGGQP